VDGGELIISHLHCERRLRPLNLYLREADDGMAVRAVLEFGQRFQTWRDPTYFPAICC